eukprot:CAMPEP_0185791542 /NCGR_PEP_ID=MMETSP1174-20130828/158430_1 /TAXON_ID=35687 /ORGANISM="Dictyocha speculum, Strain CCMP1381" /LENGTH=168 /DNA_ID=CAMNT_0028486501 /DNA_START=156 /DNA_END=662 /DNA_ORIENTATION=+
MKPDWDVLMQEYEGDATKLVGDVDCTTEDELCETYGVQGFPTLKYGDVHNLQDYEGGRDLPSLQEHAKTKLVPQCGPKNIDLCDDETRAEIEKLLEMPPDVLDGEITKLESGLADVEAAFVKAVELLQKQYEKLSEDKEEALEEIQDQGLSMMKSVKAFQKSSSHDEL